MRDPLRLVSLLDISCNIPNHGQPYIQSEIYILSSVTVHEAIINTVVCITYLRRHLPTPSISIPYSTHSSFAPRTITFPSPSQTSSKMHSSTIHFLALLSLLTSALTLPHRTQLGNILMEGKNHFETDPNQLYPNRLLDPQLLSIVTITTTVHIATTLAVLASQVTVAVTSAQTIPAQTAQPVSILPIMEESATAQTAPFFPTLSARAMTPSRAMDSTYFHPSHAPGKPVPGMPSQGQLSWGYVSSMTTVTRTMEREAGHVVGHGKSLFPTDRLEAREAGEVVGHRKSLFPTRAV